MKEHPLERSQSHSERDQRLRLSRKERLERVEREDQNNEDKGCASTYPYPGVAAIQLSLMKCASSPMEFSASSEAVMTRSNQEEAWIHGWHPHGKCPERWRHRTPTGVNRRKLNEVNAL